MAMAIRLDIELLRRTACTAIVMVSSPHTEIP
jgi:hypothetical protein